LRPPRESRSSTGTGDEGAAPIPSAGGRYICSRCGATNVGRGTSCIACGTPNQSPRTISAQTESTAGPPHGPSGPPPGPSGPPPGPSGPPPGPSGPPPGPSGPPPGPSGPPPGPSGPMPEPFSLRSGFETTTQRPVGTTSDRRIGMPRFAIVAVASLIVIGGGTVAWRAIADNDDPQPDRTAATDATPRSTPTSPTSPTPSAAPSSEPPEDPVQFAGQLEPDRASASSQLPPSTISGTRVSYGPGQAIDGSKETAWCTSGDGAGEHLILQFDVPVTVTKIGVLPGYAKIDPSTGEDRYTENRRIISAQFESTFDLLATRSFDVVSRRIQFTRLNSPTEVSLVDVIPFETTDGVDTCISEVVVIGE
jgi:hypothetical protein